MRKYVCVLAMMLLSSCAPIQPIQPQRGEDTSNVPANTSWEVIAPPESNSSVYLWLAVVLAGGIVWWLIKSKD